MTQGEFTSISSKHCYGIIYVHPEGPFNCGLMHFSTVFTNIIKSNHKCGSQWFKILSGKWNMLRYLNNSTENVEYKMRALIWRITLLPKHCLKTEIMIKISGLSSGWQLLMRSHYLRITNKWWKRCYWMSMIQSLVTKWAITRKKHICKSI